MLSLGITETQESKQTKLNYMRHMGTSPTILLWSVEKSPFKIRVLQNLLQTTNQTKQI